MILRALPVLLLAIFLPACSSTPQPQPAPPADITEGLKELGEWYKYRAAEKLPPPARAEDLAESEAVLGNAWRLIQDGAVVVVWRVGHSPGSTDVLAYEKDAPNSGGKVLLRNGTVKDMSATEFRAAKR